jgi:transposase-like protein
MIRNKDVQKSLSGMIKVAKQQQRQMQLTLRHLQSAIESDTEDEYLVDNEEMLNYLYMAIDSLNETLEYLMETAQNNWE